MSETDKNPDIARLSGWFSEARMARYATAADPAALRSQIATSGTRHHHMSIVERPCYTFDMAKIDDIYDAVDDYGLVTSAEGRALGVSDAELVQLAARGRLERVARGVYRVPVWPYQEQAPYAIAVRAAGEGAYLYGESVVALLGLCPTDPRAIWVAVPKRTRRDLGAGVRLVWRRGPDETTYYEGIACQRAAGAIRSAAATMGPERAAEAAHEAERKGYVTTAELAAIEEEVGAHA